MIRLICKKHPKWYQGKRFTGKCNVCDEIWTMLFRIRKGAVVVYVVE